MLIENPVLTRSPAQQSDFFAVKHSANQDESIPAISLDIGVAYNSLCHSVLLYLSSTRDATPSVGTDAGFVQKASISSSGVFLVSGTKYQVNTACASAMIARNPNVTAFPIRLKAYGKKRTTSALATHWVNTGTVIAVPRMLFGKISGTSVQKTGPIHEQKNPR